MAMKKYFSLLLILFYLASVPVFGQKYKLHDFDSIPKPHNHFPTDLIGITSDDNENNYYTGSPDWDMDVYLGIGEPNIPIEFNIFIEDKTISTAQLSILAWDVDWEGYAQRPGERDAVYLNDHFLGYLSGADEEWSTSIFEVNPSLINIGPNGKNTVRIEIDVLDFGWWVEVDWGQLIINNATGTAKFRYVLPDKYEYYSQETIYVTEEVDADPTMYVRVETNLLNPQGQIVAGESYFQFATMGDEPFTVSLMSGTILPPGDYLIMAILYDAASNIQQDIIYVPITILESCINPQYGGYIGYSYRECGAFDPDPFMSIQEPGMYSGTLEFKWQRSINGYVYVDIPGTNTHYYDPGMVYERTYYRRLARVDCMDNWDDAAYSNTVYIDIIDPVTVDAGPDAQIYIGYPPYETQLNSAANSGGYYYWDPPTGLSNPYIPNPIASPTETTTYTLSFWGYNGCRDTDEVTVIVTDVRCGKNLKKVLVCHHPPGNPGNAHTICIGAPAVPTHLVHGDYLGECLNGKDFKLNNDILETKVRVYPNPTSGQTNIELSLISSANVEIYVSDVLGTIVARIFNGTANEGINTYSWDAGSKHGSGMYMLYVITEAEALTRKIVLR